MLDLRISSTAYALLSQMDKLVLKKTVIKLIKCKKFGIKPTKIINDEKGYGIIVVDDVEVCFRLMKNSHILEIIDIHLKRHIY